MADTIITNDTPKKTRKPRAKKMKAVEAATPEIEAVVEEPKVESKVKTYLKAIATWVWNNGPGLAVGLFLGAFFF